ncbi:hypothetical protein D3C72_1373940 [compost metagenome]
MRKDFHNLHSIIQRWHIWIVNFYFFTCFIFLNLLFDFLCKGNICSMSRTSSHNMTFQRSTYKCQITNHIQQFMSGRLILMTQLNIIQNAFFCNGDCIVMKKMRKFLQFLRRSFFINNNNCIA